jgi:uncharacterized RDD family membrane protein YckC
VSYEDRVSIPTPEGLQVDLVLAGIGSRFIAALLDGVLQGIGVFSLTLLYIFLSAQASQSDAAGIGAAFVLIIMFLLLFAYPVAFETWAFGQTPGKRWTGLRVVTRTGAPVTFLPSAVRNLVRLVDFLPWLYGVGVIAMLFSPRNQRLGDMAAGTLVVRERTTPRTSSTLVSQTDDALARSTEAPRSLPPHWAYWDVSGVSADEVATVRRFLERRATLTPGARYHLASELAERLRPKVSGAPEWMHPEDFLAELAAIKASRG